MIYLWEYTDWQACHDDRLSRFSHHKHLYHHILQAFTSPLSQIYTFVFANADINISHVTWVSLVNLFWLSWRLQYSLKSMFSKSCNWIHMSISQVTYMYSGLAWSTRLNKLKINISGTGTGASHLQYTWGQQWKGKTGILWSTCKYERLHKHTSHLSPLLSLSHTHTKRSVVQLNICTFK
jgi:hypothetical protein